MYRKRFGFTLVELLVVIAIIGVLVGLLLPAVQAAREAARRMQCSNNMKQVGLALHNYQSATRMLPPSIGWARGAFSTGRPCTGSNYPLWSWGAFILPYMEQSALYNELDVDHRHLAQIVYDPASPKLKLLKNPIAAYRCPSDVAPNINVGRPFPFFAMETISTSNYVGSSDTVYQVCNGQVHDGVFTDLPTKFAEISDGLSNTFAVGERRWQYKSVDGQILTSKAALALGFRRTNTYHEGLNDPLSVGYSKLNYTGPEQLVASFGFSSMHSGGANFVFCDGSVHFLSDSIESSAGSDQLGASDRNIDTAWERLIARADGQPMGAF